MRSDRPITAGVNAATGITMPVCVKERFEGALK